MPEGADQEKTEPATPKRREEARNRGQVAKSRELSSVAVLLASLLIFSLYGNVMLREIMNLSREFFIHPAVVDMNIETTQRLVVQIFEGVAKVLFPLFFIIIAAGVLSNIIQVGMLFTAKPLVPDLKKLDLIKGFGRIISRKGLVELAKSIFKIAIVAWVSYITVRGELDHLPLLTDMTPWNITSYIGGVALKIIFRTCWVLIILAVLDYGFQKWDFENDLKMTKQEVKDELRQREGDPLIKARIRRIQMEMARKRMMEEVPKADVVITNPMHIAVAIRYDRFSMDAPVVLAKGVRLIAENIKKMAREHNIPVVENKPLAQSLYKLVAVGETIPDSLYRAVAEVLAYVYKMKSQ